MEVFFQREKLLVRRIWPNCREGHRSWNSVRYSVTSYPRATRPFQIQRLWGLKCREHVLASEGCKEEAGGGRARPATGEEHAAGFLSLTSSILVTMEPTADVAAS